MATLFICEADPLQQNEGTNCIIDVEDYMTQMRTRWPASEIHKSYGTHSLYWELKKSPTYTGSQGELFANSCTISIGSNPIEDVIEFIIWHRGYVSNTQILYLFDEGLSINFKLEADVTQENLRKLLT